VLRLLRPLIVAFGALGAGSGLLPAPARGQQPADAGPASAPPAVTADTTRVRGAPDPVGVSIERIDVRGLPRLDLRFTVRDASGAWVPGLTAGEVVVTVDGDTIPFGSGKARLVSRFAGGERLTVGFVVDVSGSMAGSIDDVRTAIGEFVARLAEDDEVALFTFSETVDVPVPAGGDPARVVALLDSLDMAGNTALHDAIAAAVDTVAGRPGARRAILALSDGTDNRSRIPLDRLGARVAAAGVPIYAIAFGAHADTAAMGALARATGGRRIVAGPDALRALYRELAGLLTHEYRVVFEMPAGLDDRWHDIAVAIADDVPGVPDTLRGATRPVLTAKGPGVARGFVASRREAAERARLISIGALALLGAAALVSVPLLLARVRGARVRPPAIALAALSTAALATLATLAWYFYQSGGP